MRTKLQYDQLWNYSACCKAGLEGNLHLYKFQWPKFPLLHVFPIDSKNEVKMTAMESQKLLVFKTTLHFICLQGAAFLVCSHIQETLDAIEHSKGMESWHQQRLGFYWPKSYHFPVFNLMYLPTTHWKMATFRSVKVQVLLVLRIVTQTVHV